MNIKDLIAEVRAHDAGATPGPWLHYKRAHPSPAWAVTDVEDENAQQITAEGDPNDIALIAHYRTAAPLLANAVEWLESNRDEMLRVLEYFAADRRGERCEEFFPWTPCGIVALDLLATMRAENAALRNNLQNIEHALGTRRKPGETREWTIAEMFADLDRAEQERAAIRAAVNLSADDPPSAVLEEIRRLQGKCGEPRLAIAAERSQDSGAWVREVEARNRLDVAPIGLQWNDAEPEPTPVSARDRRHS